MRVTSKLPLRSHIAHFSKFTPFTLLASFKFLLLHIHSTFSTQAKKHTYINTLTHICNFVENDLAKQLFLHIKLQREVKSNSLGSTIDPHTLWWTPDCKYAERAIHLTCVHPTSPRINRMMSKITPWQINPPLVNTVISSINTLHFSITDHLYVRVNAYWFDSPTNTRRR